MRQGHWDERLIIRGDGTLCVRAIDSYAEHVTTVQPNCKWPCTTLGATYPLLLEKDAIGFALSIYLYNYSLVFCYQVAFQEVRDS